MSGVVRPRTFLANADAPEKLLPLKADAFDVGFSLTDKTYVTAEYKTKTRTYYATAAEKRDGDELTAACASDPDAIGKARRVLDTIIGKEK